MNIYIYSFPRAMPDVLAALALAKVSPVRVPRHRIKAVRL